MDLETWLLINLVILMWIILFFVYKIECVVRRLRTR